MSQKAKEIFEYANRKRENLNKEYLKSLKERVTNSITEMMKNGEFVTEIDLSDKDMCVIQSFGKEMRELGYLYCLIEEQDEEGDVLGYRLRISVEYLK